MAVTEAFVRHIFNGLESGDGAAFLSHVADDVDWTVTGTHPLAGHYHSKADFTAATFGRLSKILPNGTQLQVEHMIVSGDEAVVEMRSNAVAKNGLRFDNRYCWVIKFENDVIVRVRAYLDSALVARLIAENPVE